MSSTRASQPRQAATVPPEAGALFQFLNLELQQLYRGDKSLSHRDLELLLRYSLLIGCGRVKIPAAGFFEDDLAMALLRLTKPLSGSTAVTYISPTPDLHEYEEKKRREYRDQPTLYSRYQVSEANGKFSLAKKVARQIGYTPRIWCSAADEIGKVWRGFVEDESVSRSLVSSVAQRLGVVRESALARLHAVPNMLDDRAFVPANVCATLATDVALQDLMQLRMILSQGFLISFLREYDVALVVDTRYGRFDAGLYEVGSAWRHRCVSLLRMQHRLNALGLKGAFESWLSIESLTQIASGAYWAACWSFLASSDYQSSLREPLILAQMKKLTKVSSTVPSDERAIVDASEERLAELLGHIGARHEWFDGELERNVSYPAQRGRRNGTRTLDGGFVLTSDEDASPNPAGIGADCIQREDVIRVREALTAAREQLVDLDPAVWGAVANWVASVRPVLATALPDQVDTFDAVTRTPRWVTSPIDRQRQHENHLAQAASAGGPRDAKERILAYISGLLAVPQRLASTGPILGGADPQIVIHNHVEAIMGDKYTTSISDSNVGAAAIGPGATATGHVLPVSAPPTQEQHRKSIASAQAALVRDQDALDALDARMFEALGQFLRLAREIQVEQKSLGELQARMKNTLDEVWAEQVAKGLKPQVLPKTLEVARAIADNPVLLEVTKQLMGA